MVIYVVICLFPKLQQLYAYMYLALGVNTGKIVFHSEYWQKK